MPISCLCRLTSPPDAFPATYDQSECPTHGPHAPQYFVDHGTIHDRITGRHVEIDEAAALLNERGAV